MEKQENIDRIQYLEDKLKKRNLLERLEPADLIAFLVIGGVLLLNWKGIETMLSQSISVVIGFYFGHKMTQRTK